LFVGEVSPLLYVQFGIKNSIIMCDVLKYHLRKVSEVKNIIWRCLSVCRYCLRSCLIGFN